jgi:hypothetical protein
MLMTKPDGIIPVPTDGGVDYIACCALHQRASLRYVSEEDARYWQCAVCAAAFSEGVEARRYADLRRRVE